MQEYYSQRASTPGTFLITEATLVALEAGGLKHAPGVYSQTQITAWKEIVAGVHAANSYIYCQLWAFGRQANEGDLKEDDPSLSVVGPSSIPMNNHGAPVPRALTVPEIQEYIHLYATAARNAVHEAGFDGVEIHGGNGYLIDQFLQDVSNQRQDDYGGTIERRSRFGLEVVRAVVDALGTPTKVGIRLSPWSTFSGMGMDNPIPQFTYFVEKLRREFPDLAYIHVIEPRVAGDRDDNVGAQKSHSANDFLRDIWAPKPYISAGGYSRFNAVQRTQERQNELIAFGRWFISNPDLPIRLEKDLELNPYDRGTFFLSGDTTGRGYTDYNFVHTSIDTLLSASLPEASYDSAARDPAPQCFPGTRELYIKEVMDWALSRGTHSYDHLPILWLKEPAGVGKTAVAQTCTERLKRINQPCAAVFFSIKGRSDPKRLFPSIAYQLATIHPEYYALLDAIVRRDRTLVDKSPRFQLQKLIVEPLRQLHHSGKGFLQQVPIIIDGLDECEGGRAAHCTVIDLITEVTQEAIPLVLAFFSRPEAHIEASFARVNAAKLTHAVFLPISRTTDNEIASFVRGGFRDIAQRTNLSPQPPWPADDDVDLIVRAAGGLFSYAAAILRHASLIVWCNLLRISRFTFRIICNQLSAVLQYREKSFEVEYPNQVVDHEDWNYMFPVVHDTIRHHAGGSISFFHKSFIDFLQDPSRSGDYCMHSPVMHRLLSQHLAELWREYDTQIYLPGSGSSIAIYPLSQTSPDIRTKDWSISSVPKIAEPSPLSEPHPDQFVNLVIIGEVYSWLHSMSNRLIDRGLLDIRSARSFNKGNHRLGLQLMSSRLLGNRSERVWYQRCECRTTSYEGTTLLRLLPQAFSDFDVAEYRESIRRRQEAGLIKPFYRNTFERLKAMILRHKTRGPLESGFYKMGKGEKSIIWYWEINHEKRYYQSIRSPSLDDAMRVYEREDIDHWLRNWDEAVSWKTSTEHVEQSLVFAPPPY
ncbi:hypothetical protein NP233_g692 [Leucocoprinus birnbaumii]|uniref:Uncharacterized protein n=1 Tax=Leucocoprinus birnbaumii TaxID=56174 RepID=A0AAD5YYH6_9AGAR|nr:hypothetical protein NP233_g692 [Leucocoprinus birnbaumii]